MKTTELMEVRMIKDYGITLSHGPFTDLASEAVPAQRFIKVWLIDSNSSSNVYNVIWNGYHSQAN